MCVLRWRRDLTGGCILSKFSLACRSLVKRVVGEHDTLLKDISIRHKITAFFSRLREACACMRGENENNAFPQTWFFMPKKKSLLLSLCLFSLPLFSSDWSLSSSSSSSASPRSFTPLMEIQYSCYGECKLAHDCQGVFTLHPMRL